MLLCRLCASDAPVEHAREVWYAALLLRCSASKPALLKGLRLQHGSSQQRRTSELQHSRSQGPKIYGIEHSKGFGFLECPPT